MMDLAANFYIAIRDFLERGGSVLLVIILVTLSMWTLILNRWLYLRFDYRWDADEALKRHPAGTTKYRKYAQQATLSHLAARLNAGLPVVKTLAHLCPLLGLLGTVVGMIHIFDMMVALGTSSPRSVASGVSLAMVTTMAGMVGALSGIFPAAALRRRAAARLNDLRSKVEAASTMAARPPRRPVWNGNLRRALAPVGALVVTLSLSFFMEEMIVIGRAALSESSPSFRVDFVRVARENVVKTRKPKMSRPETPPEPPKLDSPDVDPEADSSTLLVAAPEVDARAGHGGVKVPSGFMGLTEGDYQPLVKIHPVYPYRAEARHLEGWVVVRFTISTSGSVRDVEVVDSSDEVFETAAVEAAEKFKYRPRVVNGEPVEVHGVLNRLTFTFQQ